MGAGAVVCGAVAAGDSAGARAGSGAVATGVGARSMSNNTAAAPIASPAARMIPSRCFIVALRRGYVMNPR